MTPEAPYTLKYTPRPPLLFELLDCSKSSRQCSLPSFLTYSRGGQFTHVALTGQQLRQQRVDARGGI